MKKQYKKDKLNTLDIKQPTKTLGTIKVFVMIAKVISMIVFVLAIIGTVAGVVGGALFIANKDVIYTSTRTFESYWFNTYGVSVYTTSLMLVSGAIACAGTIPVAWLAWKFFGNIIRNKTPFTFKSGREGIRLAIVTAATMIAGLIIWGIIAIVYAKNFNGQDMYGLQVSNIWYPFEAKLVGAIIYLILGFIFRHGAQVREINYAKPEK